MKYIFILLFSASVAFGQGSRMQPGGVPTMSPVFDFSSISNELSILSSNIFNINAGDITNQLGSNSIVISNLVTDLSSVSNTLYAFVTNTPSFLDGFTMPVLISGVSNVYNWDWGKTNGSGQPLIYATLLATNDSLFLGPSNLVKWRPFSYDVVASGGTRVIYMPTNITFLATNFGINNLWRSNSYYALYLSNNCLFRMTLQSNIVFEPIWILRGQ